MDKVSDKKVQRRASHKKRVWTIRVWAKQGVNTSVPEERRQDSVVKKGKLIQFIYLDTLQLKFKCSKY
jgi:hypothetical protein